MGRPAGMVMLRGSRRAFPEAAGRWPHCDPVTYAHWVTVSDGIAVDWTARQFEPGADFPRILPVAELSAAWAEVTVWACEECPELVSDARHLEPAPPGLHAEHAAQRGMGPFRDPRHDADPGPLVPLCHCG